MTEVHPAHQFAELAQQREATHLGVWTFLATEVLFFGGVFTAYTVYRHAFTEGFVRAIQHTDVLLGGINTGMLLTSSVVMTVAIISAGLGQRRVLTFSLLLAAFLGVVFLGIKGTEYLHEFQEGLLPGPWFDFHGPYSHTVELFFLLYFVATGVHAIHLGVGVCLVLFTACRAWRGAYPPANHNFVEGVALYWHFVDCIWLFIFPLFYLAGKGVT